MNAFTKSLIILFSTLILLHAQAYAEILKPIIPEPTLNQCAELLKECHAKGDQERVNCFYSSAKHPFCEGSELGKLAYKRWIMSPVRNGGLQSAPALLGPAIIDQECLKSFDSLWLSKLIVPSTLSTSMTTLNSSLSKCTKELSEQLTRP